MAHLLLGLFISSGKFEQYDYGLKKNEELYNSRTPPIYDVKRIKVPISLHYSSNDWLANVKVCDYFTYSSFQALFF